MDRRKLALFVAGLCAVSSVGVGQEKRDDPQKNPPTVSDFDQALDRSTELLRMGTATAESLMTLHRVNGDSDDARQLEANLCGNNPKVNDAARELGLMSRYFNADKARLADAVTHIHNFADRRDAWSKLADRYVGDAEQLEAMGVGCPAPTPASSEQLSAPRQTASTALTNKVGMPKTAKMSGGGVHAKERKPVPTEADELLLLEKTIAAYEKGKELATQYEAALESEPTVEAPGSESQRLHAEWCRNDEAAGTAFNDAIGWSMDQRHAAVLGSLTDDETVERRIRFEELNGVQKKYFSLRSGIPCPFKETAAAPKYEAKATASKTTGTEVWVVLVIAGILVYFLPSVIGDRKRNRWAIFMLNLLAGWTVVGWIIAMVWACCAEASEGRAANDVPPVAVQNYCSACGTRVVGQFCSGCGKRAA